MENNLPIALAIASQSVELDNIKIKPVTTETGIRCSICVLNNGNWKNKLIKKCSQYINKDIKNSLEINKDITFYPYTLGDIKFNWFFVTINLHYEIK